MASVILPFFSRCLINENHTITSHRPPAAARQGTGEGATTPRLTDVLGRADDDLYVFSNDNGNILTPALDTLPPMLGNK